MRQLLALLLVVGLAAVGCGSGDGAPQSSGTETSQRIERQATVSEQQAEQETVEAEPVQQAQQNEQVEQTQQPMQNTERPQQIQEAEDDVEDEPQADELPVEIVGVHKGVRSEGRMLGEPDAPVLIEHFGDFT